MKRHINTVGVQKEVKDHEGRVGLVPQGVAELARAGHKVFVETGAGVASMYPDADYIAAGATVVSTPMEVAERSDIVVKVKEPVSEEYAWLKAMQGKTLLTFLHLSDNPELAKQLLKNKISGVSYDTIEDEEGKLPLLKPMSEIAGKFAVNFFAQEIHDHKILRVLIVGGGVTGEAAVRQCIDLGVPDIEVYEKNASRAVELEHMFEHDPVDVYVCDKKLKKLVAKSDLLVGAVLVKGSKCPVVVTEDMILARQAGRYVVDISIDQGGCIYGSVPTTHSNPTFEFLKQTYCCIPNMPGYIPHEATVALTKVSFPYLQEMAKRGTFQYFVQKPWLLKGLNTHAGKITNQTVAEDLNRQHDFVKLSF